MTPDFSSFNAFISSTAGETIGQGECWDYINLLWSHLGSRYWTYPPDDPEATNHGVKWGWLNTDARAANTIYHLTPIYNLNNIKRGDVVVWSYGTYGHAGFANEDYNGSGYLETYSQNYSGQLVTLDNINTATFLGAWRYDEWNQPTPPVPTARKKFPWVLYARKIRDSKNIRSMV